MSTKTKYKTKTSCSITIHNTLHVYMLGRVVYKISHGIIIGIAIGHSHSHSHSHRHMHRGSIGIGIGVDSYQRSDIL